jgi:hypothetical protein
MQIVGLNDIQILSCLAPSISGNRDLQSLFCDRKRKSNPPCLAVAITDPWPRRAALAAANRTNGVIRSPTKFEFGLSSLLTGNHPIFKADLRGGTHHLTLE